MASLGKASWTSRNLYLTASEQVLGMISLRRSDTLSPPRGGNGLPTLKWMKFGDRVVCLRRSVDWSFSSAPITLESAWQTLLFKTNRPCRNRTSWRWHCHWYNLNTWRQFCACQEKLTLCWWSWSNYLPPKFPCGLSDILVAFWACFRSPVFPDLLWVLSTTLSWVHHMVISPPLPWYKSHVFVWLEYRP